MRKKAPKHIKLDERNHVEKPLLDQLNGLGWEIIDLTDEKQKPSDTFRENFTEVVMLPVLREQLKVINPWLEDDQVEEVVKQLIASFPSRQASSTVFSQLLPFVALTRFWGVCFRSQRLRLARLRGEFPDGFLTVVAAAAMLYGLRGTWL